MQHIFNITKLKRHVFYTSYRRRTEERRLSIPPVRARRCCPSERMRRGPVSRHHVGVFWSSVSRRTPVVTAEHNVVVSHSESACRRAPRPWKGFSQLSSGVETDRPPIIWSHSTLPLSLSLSLSLSRSLTLSISHTHRLSLTHTHSPLLSSPLLSLPHTLWALSLVSHWSEHWSEFHASDGGNLQFSFHMRDKVSSALVVSCYYLFVCAGD